MMRQRQKEMWENYRTVRAVLSPGRSSSAAASLDLPEAASSRFSIPLGFLGVFSSLKLW